MPAPVSALPPLRPHSSQELLEACAAEREARAQTEAAAAAMAQQRHLSTRHVLAFEELANLRHRVRVGEGWVGEGRWEEKRGG